MGQEETRFLPHFGDQFVQIVGRRRAGQGRNTLRLINAGQQPVLRVIDQLILLALFNGFNRQTQLFANLIVRAAV
ncbi:hypothetical protein D3C78_1756070 [compost metagenome]